MNNLFFILVSVAIFLLQYFLLIFWPFILQVNLFIVWALVVFFLDYQRRFNWPTLFGASIFFDLWSSASFGSLTLALFLTCLVIFLIKKIILLENCSRLSVSIWLVGFYYLYIFLEMAMRSFYEKPVLPTFNPIGLVEIIFWIMIMMMVHKVLSDEKKVSRF